MAQEIDVRRAAKVDGRCPHCGGTL